MSTAIVLVVSLPVMMAVAMLTGPGRIAAARLAWVAPLPALLLALWPDPQPPGALDWLLLGGSVGVDPIARTFLLFTAVLWSTAGAYACHYVHDDPRRDRFFAFHLLTLSGNLGLIVAQDLASFYAAFAVMTFAGYGLVVHTGTAEALRAGRIYLVMAVIGETMLLAAFLMAAAGARSLALADVAAAVSASPQRNLVIALLLGGFGIKAGSLPLHVWLPLAHPVAPTPASAVLSGSMIKAGLLGWLRFLPLGIVALREWGLVLIVAGIAAAFFGVIVGVTQRQAKTALAYSSISQMGLINVAVGIGLASPDGWPLALAACLTYVVHHGLAKGALFLGVGVAAEARGRRERLVAMAGMLFLALAVAGAPFTSGGVAKEYLKDVAALSPLRWPFGLELLLPIAALGTTLLMARVLVLVAASIPDPHRGVQRSALWRSWLVLLGAVGLMVWVLPAYYELEVFPPTIPALESIWVSVWPITGGAVLAWLVILLRRRGRFDPGRLQITPGDLLVPMERLAGGLRRRAGAGEIGKAPKPVVSLGSKWYGVYASGEGIELLHQLEVRLTRWRVAGFLFLLLTVGLALTLALAR